MSRQKHPQNTVGRGGDRKKVCRVLLFGKHKRRDVQREAQRVGWPRGLEMSSDTALKWENPVNAVLHIRIKNTSLAAGQHAHAEGV